MLKRKFDSAATIKFFDLKGNLQKVQLTDEFGLKIIIINPWNLADAIQTAEQLTPSEIAIKTGKADVYKLTG